MQSAVSPTHHRRLKRGAIILAGCAAAVAAAAVIADSTKPQDKPAAPGASAPQVSAAIVASRPVLETHEFSGRLEAVDKAEIRPRVAGYVTAIRFQAGAIVKKGDSLFTIDARPYEIEKDRAEAAEQSIRSKLDLARLELARAENLLAESAVAQKEVDSKTSAVRQLAAQLDEAHANLQAARLNLEYTQVRSPISGRVGKAEITQGNLVDASTILTEVVSKDPIYASFDGDEATYLRVAQLARDHQSAAVQIGLATESGFPHTGTLDFVDSGLDPAAGSVRMRAVVGNGAGELAPGLFVRVQLADSGQARNAVVIADSAVGTDQNRKFVYVIGADGKAAYRPVKLGPLSNGMRVVRAGLEPGEKIVVNGLQRVRPGKQAAFELVHMEDGSPVASEEKKPAPRDAQPGQLGQLAAEERRQ